MLNTAEDDFRNILQNFGKSNQYRSSIIQVEFTVVKSYLRQLGVIWMCARARARVCARARARVWVRARARACVTNGNMYVCEALIITGRCSQNLLFIVFILIFQDHSQTDAVHSGSGELMYRSINYKHQVAEKYAIL